MNFEVRTGTINNTSTGYFVDSRTSWKQPLNMHSFLISRSTYFTFLHSFKFLATLLNNVQKKVWNTLINLGLNSLMLKLYYSYQLTVLQLWFDKVVIYPRSIQEVIIFSLRPPQTLLCFAGIEIETLEPRVVVIVVWKQLKKDNKCSKFFLNYTTFFTKAFFAIFNYRDC